MRQTSGDEDTATFHSGYCYHSQKGYKKVLLNISNNPSYISFRSGNIRSLDLEESFLDQGKKNTSFDIYTKTQ